MSIRENITAPDGFRLVRGPIGDCRRDPKRPRGWRGLSAGDTALLVKWLLDEAPSDVDLYTDVPCGTEVDLDGTDVPAWLGSMAAAVSCLRIDAVTFFDGAWSLIELKPSAGYTAMGQVLTYGYYAPLRAPGLAGARLLVVTDRLQDVCRPVYKRYGVAVCEVGDVGL